MVCSSFTAFIPADYVELEKLKSDEIQYTSSQNTSIENLGWGNQSTYSGNASDGATKILTLDNYSVIITRKSSATLSNGTISNSNGSQGVPGSVLILIYDQNNSLVKHYHFGGSSSSVASEVYAVAKNPTGGFVAAGCYWAGAAYIGNHRFSSYGVGGTCAHGFLVSFNETFDLVFAKEMVADSTGIANSNTWASLTVDDNGSIYISGSYKQCNSSNCLKFYDTDNSGNVKKTPAVSTVCSHTSKGYIYIAKLSNTGSWQWVKTAGGSTLGPFINDIQSLNNSIYIAGSFDSCGYSAGTANFGSHSFTATGKCISTSGGSTCSSMTRAFVAKISDSGSWSGLINTSGEIVFVSSQPVAFNPPTKLSLDSDGTNLFMAGQFSSQAWGLKFGNFVLPSSGFSSFYSKFNQNLVYSKSVIIGGTADQVRCPLFHSTNGTIWISGQFADDFMVDNTSYVRSSAGEVFVNIDSNLTPLKIIYFTGPISNNPCRANGLGTKASSNYVIISDGQGFTIASTAYPSTGGFALYVEFGEDYDDDTLSNSIDTDDDGDSVPDTSDSCQKGKIFYSRLATDRDQDGCRDSDEDFDDDGDGLNDTLDSCATGVMYWTRNTTTDYDDDGCNDASEDFDDDNDNYQDFEDMCPRLVGNSTYSNEKGCPDEDGDGRANMTDPFPNDSSEWKDTDGDGYGDNGDEYPLDATQHADTDGDGYGDNSNGNSGDKCPSTAGNSTADRLGCVDSDGDGYSDLGDAFDNNPTQYIDSDGDGYGNNQSTNATQSDAFPSDGTQWEDADGDGHGDNPYGSQGDWFPNNPNRWQDS
ncbi:MAG: hypothetical protein OR994_02195, partial [Candidatus Poseidoniales archaeon]|nr:hypothetical protein [Candidatus Poseidoniales archaeon]